MGRVIASNFERHGNTALRGPERTGAPDHPSPLFSDTDIWARDYSLVDGVMFGVCAVSEILSRHLGREGRWPVLLLDLLKAADLQSRDATPALSQSARDLKDLIISAIGRANSRDLSAALLIVDLIEYTPKYRKNTGN